MHLPVRMRLIVNMLLLRETPHKYAKASEHDKVWC